MKKKALIIPFLTFTAAACIGCSNNGEEDYSKIYSDLQNFKLDNLNDYQAIGVGSVNTSASKKGKKKLREEETDNQEEAVYISDIGRQITKKQLVSPHPFTLIGQLKDGEIEDLAFSNGKESLNVPICCYLNWGDFITFRVGDFYDGCGSYFLDELEYFYDSDNTFTLSKKTGKIYKNGIVGNVDGMEKWIKEKDGSILFIQESLWKAYENDDGLNFKPLGTHDHDKLNVDKYGNAYVENGIIAAADSKLHKFTSYLDGKATFVFDKINGEIYAFASDSQTTYLFNENGELVETPACGLYSGYLRNDNGETINYNDRSTWSEETLQTWLESNKGNIDNYAELKGNNFATLSKEQFLEAYRSNHNNISMLENGELLYRWSYGSDNSFSNYGAYPALYSTEDSLSYYATDYGIKGYRHLDEHAYIQKATTPEDELSKFNQIQKEGEVAKRGNNLYVFSNDKRVCKYSFEQDKMEELIFDGYDLKSMGVQDGQIILTGTDDSFNEFEGHLDQNDKISFEQTKSSDPIVLTPIN